MVYTLYISVCASLYIIAIQKFGVRKIFFIIKELNTFIFSKDVIKDIKIFTVQTFIMLQNVISNKQKNDNFHRNIKQHNCFNTDNNTHFLSIKWFLHVTLKSGAMTADSSAFSESKSERALLPSVFTHTRNLSWS